MRMDRVAFVVASILGATAALVGVSYGAGYLYPYLDEIPAYWCATPALAGLAIFISLRIRRRRRAMHH
jgi:hypothetical protein